MAVSPSEFLAAVLPAQGPYIFSSPRKVDGETQFRAVHFDAIDAALRWVAEQSDRGVDV